MILVLTDGDRRVWIDVVLKDGCEVRVGNQTVDCSNVEPVPWYKVCVLDYLTVDVKKNTLAWVVETALRHHTPSQTSLANDSVGGPTSQSHDSGCVVTGDDSGLIEGNLRTISETPSPRLSAEISASFESGATVHEGRHGDSASRFSASQSTTLPRAGGTVMSRDISAAELFLSDRVEKAGHRRTLSDAAQHQLRDEKILERFPLDRIASSTLRPSGPSQTSLGSGASGPRGVAGPTGNAVGGAAALGDSDDAMYDALDSEHVLNTADLLSMLENNLDYDTSVVYQIFQLCNRLLLEVISKPPPEHNKWIEEHCPYGRLISDVEHIESLIQILHSHLLPFIVLHEEDRGSVQWAIRRQQDAINILSEDILAHSRQGSSLESSVEGLLARLLPGIEKSLQDHIFCRQFLTQVAADIDGRGHVRRINENLDFSQQKINDLKKKMREDITEDTPANRDLLRNLRARRNDYHTELTDVLKTRELLVLNLQRQREDSGKLLPAQQSYMRACKVFEEHEKRTAYKLDKKVAALGMREALLEAVQHLSEESPDEPIDMTASMSVTGLSRVPRSALTASLGRVRKELLPLTDAVKGVVCDPSHPIGQRHLVFCEEITVLCTDTAMPNILAFGVPRVGPVVLEERGDGVSRANHMQRLLGRAVSIYEVIDPAREYIDDVATKILEHEDAIVADLQDEFQGHTEQLHRKLYLTYERMLFAKIGFTLDDLYMVWAQKIVNQLLRVTEFVENVSFDELRAHLRFPEGWWVNLFNEPSDANADDRREAVFSPKAPLAPFQKLLAPAGAALHRLIGTVWPLNKAELLTKAIQHITRSLGEYESMRIGRRGSAHVQVGADDLVPVVILFILYTKPEIIATLCMNCLLLEDLLPMFLRNGIHGFSMVQFQGALHVIANLLPTEEINRANSTGTAIN